MLRHVVVLRWTPETTDDDIAAVEAGLAELPAAIPELVDYRFGRDAGLTEGNGDFVVVADCATAADYLVYRDHPQHQAVIRERIAPHLAERTAIQYEC